VEIGVVLTPYVEENGKAVPGGALDTVEESNDFSCLVGYSDQIRKYKNKRLKR
jgi:hypothetical protein